jgi:hypothetical protein
VVVAVGEPPVPPAPVVVAVGEPPVPPAPVVVAVGEPPVPPAVTQSAASRAPEITREQLATMIADAARLVVSGLELIERIL